MRRPRSLVLTWCFLQWLESIHRDLEEILPAIIHPKNEPRLATVVVVVVVGLMELLITIESAGGKDERKTN